MPAWISCDPTDRYQTCLISKPGVRATSNAGRTKRNKRVIELSNGGQVFPIPWKMLEVVNTIPAATKLSATILRYSLPKAITWDHARTEQSAKPGGEVGQQRENEHHGRCDRDRGVNGLPHTIGAAPAEVLSNHGRNGEGQGHDRQKERLHDARAYSEPGLGGWSKARMMP